MYIYIYFCISTCVSTSAYLLLYVGVFVHAYVYHCISTCVNLPVHGMMILRSDELDAVKRFLI